MTRAPTLRMARVSGWLVALFAIWCVWINPIGYIGGGNDDGQYLDAARCWVAQMGPCLPHSHWWSRWPVIAPMAINLALFGETRTALGIGAGLYWAMALALVNWVAARWFGRGAGLIATLLLAATPTMTAPALQPTVDIPEIMFHLGALALATLAFERQDRRIAIAAGIVAGLALHARDTSVVFLAASALCWLFLPRDRRTVLLWTIIGLAGVVACEMLTYSRVTGDPLRRYRLAVGHVSIPTDQLPADFKIGQRPFFNPAYIAAWKREVDIDLWWPIDPWLNLLASPKIGQLLVALGVLAALFWSKLLIGQRRALGLLLGAAAFTAVTLTYALAIDPKPRMFMDLTVATAIAIGALAMAGWRNGSRAMVVVVIALATMIGVRALSLFPSTTVAEAGARQWIAHYGNQIELDDNSRAYLRLVPSSRSLARAGTGRRYRIAVTLGTCRQFVTPAPGRPQKARVLDWKGGPNPVQGRMCLLEYVRPIAPPDGGAAA